MTNHSQKKHSTATLRAMKEAGERITMVTAYDAGQAAIVADAGLDVILVGDSLGNVVLGYETTIPVTMEDMLHHARAVRRGAQNTMMIVDMPFLSYHQTTADTVQRAGTLMQQAFADGVKLEGGREIVPHIKALVQAGIPVCGHLGLTPQAVLQMGGYKVQGKDQETAKRIIEDAAHLVDAGVFMIVLECVPSALAKAVTDLVPVPTIGIGAGAACTGQVLVFHDLLGLTDRHRPKFVKPFAALREEMVRALKDYHTEVKQGEFPSRDYSYEIGGEAIAALYGREIGKGRD